MPVMIAVFMSQKLTGYRCVDVGVLVAVRYTRIAAWMFVSLGQLCRIVVPTAIVSVVSPEARYTSKSP
jgi:hypothetical protein